MSLHWYEVALRRICFSLRHWHCSIAFGIRALVRAMQCHRPLQHSVKPDESWGLLFSALVSQIKIQSLETTGVCRLREINGTTSQKVGEMEGFAEQYLQTLKGTCWWCTSWKKSVLMYSGGHNSAEWHFVFCNNIKYRLCVSGVRYVYILLPLESFVRSLIISGPLSIFLYLKSVADILIPKNNAWRI